MDTETLGIAIIGAGHAADVHVRAYRSLPGVRLVSVTSRTGERARAFARTHGIPQVVEDYAEVLNRDDVDVVDLCVPNPNHGVMAVLAAEAGKHIICEKPLTGAFGGPSGDGRATAEEMLREARRSARSVLDAVERSGVRFMYAENWLYAPAIRKARALVQASRSRILEARGEESHHGSHSANARSWALSGGGALMNLGTHPIAAILHLKVCEGLWREGTPIRPRSVLADVAHFGRAGLRSDGVTSFLQEGGDEVEDWATVIVTFEDETKAVVSASYNALGGLRDTLDLYLSNSRIHCDLSRNDTVEAYAPAESVFRDVYLTEKLETPSGWSHPSVDEEWMLGYRGELEDFISALRSGRAVDADGRLAADVVDVVYSAYLSAQRSTAVPLGDERSGGELDVTERARSI
jgi:predicted dehydrogenase